MDPVFLDQMDQELTGWSDPVSSLHAVLENDGLALYCQPIRALTGAQGYPLAEVFVRMRKEENSMLPPGEFLPVFEHYKMMPFLDRWVVRTLARRLRSGSRIPRYTVNLSSQTLEDPEFPDFVAAQARAKGISPGSMLFEIDEADLIARPWAVEISGAALKRIGSGTVIDGFGHRSVSFAPLKTLRVEFLKVAGSITRGLLAGGTAETKAKAIVRVGDALGIGVIAECVEDQDVLLRYKALGAGYAQGFGIYEPQPIDTFATQPAAKARPVNHAALMPAA